MTSNNVVHEPAKVSVPSITTYRALGLGVTAGLQRVCSHLRRGFETLPVARYDDDSTISVTCSVANLLEAERGSITM